MRGRGSNDLARRDLKRQSSCHRRIFSRRPKLMRSSGMSKDETVEKLAAALTSAMSSGDAEKIRVGAGEMRAKKPFLYSGLHDTFSAAINRAKDGKPIEAFI